VCALLNTHGAFGAFGAFDSITSREVSKYTSRILHMCVVCLTNIMGGARQTHQRHQRHHVGASPMWLGQWVGSSGRRALHDGFPRYKARGTPHDGRSA
jgi:hypothetical protein